MSASARSWTKVAKTASKSRSVLASRMWSCSPRVWAAAFRSPEKASARVGLVGSTSAPTILDTGQQFVQHLQPLRPYLTFRLVTPVRLPPGRFQAGDKSNLNRVDRYAEDDGIAAVAAFAASAEGVPPAATITADLTVSQLSRESWQSIILAFRPTILHLDVLALDIACFFQPLAERTQTDPSSGQAIRCRAIRSLASPVAAPAPRAAMQPQHHQTA